MGRHRKYDYDEVARLYYNEGKSISEIARMFNTSYQAIRYAVSQIDINDDTSYGDGDNDYGLTEYYKDKYQRSERTAPDKDYDGDSFISPFKGMEGLKLDETDDEELQEVREEDDDVEWEDFDELPANTKVVDNLVKLDKKERRVREKFNILKRKYRKAIDENHILNKKLNIYSMLDERESPIIKIEKPVKTGHADLTAVLVASDWHIEEEVDPQTVNGVNAYNIDIAQKRATRFFRSAIKLIDIQRNGGDINKLLFVLGGDFITGYLHEGDEEANSLSPTEAVIVAFDMLKNGIDFLIEHGGFDKISVVCRIGNHGRDNQKIRIKTQHKHSYEMIMYEMLRKQFIDTDKISFYIGKSAYDIVDLYGYKFRIHHGDTVRYRGGVGGLHIPLNKKISRWNKTFPVDYDILGHFHQLMDGGNFVVNGSLIGYNRYADDLGLKYEPPKQVVFFVDSKRGKTMMNPIYVDE